MKANIVYSTEFRIPKTLPHAGPPEGTDPENWDYNIFNDCLNIKGNFLVLTSNCGQTLFRGWKEEVDCFLIPLGCFIEYEGARRALSAVAGIEFPECVVTNVESSLGKFLTLEDYDYARVTSMPVMKNVVRFLKATHSTNPRAEAEARMWLMHLEDALRSVIDMDDPYRNPIHSDGSKGWLG
jgi:hypothetical protein